MNFFRRWLNSSVFIPLIMSILVAVVALVSSYNLARNIETHQKQLFEQQMKAVKMTLDAEVAAMLSSTKFQAKLLAASSDTGLFQTEIWRHPQIDETAVLTISKTDANLLRVQSSSNGAQLLKDGDTLSMLIDQKTALSGGNFLYPQKKPTHLLMLENGGKGKLLLSALKIETLMRIAESSAIGFIAFNFHDTTTGSSLSKSAGWKNTGSTDESSTLILASSVLTLVGQPTDAMRSLLLVKNPITILLIGLAFSLLIFGFLFATLKFRHEHGKRKIDSKLQRESCKKNMMELMQQLSNASGLTFWFYNTKGKIKIFGPWPELDENDSHTFDIKKLTERIIDHESFLKSLNNALSLKESWSFLYQKHIDSEIHVFQAIAVPTSLGKDDFLGLIGVRMDVTNALRANIHGPISMHEMPFKGI